MTQMSSKGKIRESKTNNQLVTSLIFSKVAGTGVWVEERLGCCGVHDARAETQSPSAPHALSLLVLIIILIKFKFCLFDTL